MGLERRGRYPVCPVGAFESTQIFRARRGREKVPGGATGGAHGPRNEPSPFFALFINGLRAHHRTMQDDRRVQLGLDQFMNGN